MFNQLKQWREERGLNEYNFESQIRCDVEELFELMGYEANDDSTISISYLVTDFMNRYFIPNIEPKNTTKIDAHCDKVIFAINAIEQLGYNAEECMNETIKEISSRTGEVNKDTGKWCKYTTDEAKAKWYKANYEGCRK